MLLIKRNVFVIKEDAMKNRLPQSPTEIFKVCASDAVAKVLSKVFNPKLLHG